MSRSRKKHPAGGRTAAKSDSEGKQHAARAERHAVRVALRGDPMRELMPEAREVYNAATFPKDGRQWFGRGYPHLLRK